MWGVVAAVVLDAGQARAQMTLFADNFDRPDNRDIDAVSTGITNNTGTTFSASAVYTSPWVDPNTVGPGFGLPDGNAANGGGQQILNNELQLKYGPGTANAFVNHNFTNASILSAGGFSVSLDVLGYNQTTNQQGAAIAVGMSLVEAQAGHDAFDGQPSPVAKYTNAFPNGGFSGTILSDFYLGIRGDSTLAWGSGSGPATTAAISAKTGSIKATFGVTSFNAGAPVTYEVFYNGVSQGVGIFNWSGTNENYIGLDGRTNTEMRVDNLSIGTALPPPKPTVTIDRDSGNITLTNLTTSPVSISSYSFITASGGFNQAAWNSIQVQGIDTNDTWIRFTAPGSTTDLAEGTLGEYTIAATNPGTTDQINLGNAWRRSPFEDVAFELRDSNGNEVPTIVKYVGNNGNSFQVGDFSLNGTLDVADWVTLRSHLTSSVAALAPIDRYFAGDLNNDGLVNQIDFRTFKGFFPASGPNSFAAIIGVPEPSALVIGLVAGSIWVLSRGWSKKLTVGVLAVAAITGTSFIERATAVDLFVDTFDRPDSMNIDVVKTGITGSVGAALPADGVYTSPWVDPASETTGPDADPANGGGQRILANQYQKYAAGTANFFVNHNFTDAAITGAKGFRVTLDVADFSQATDGQGGAFAIGMSQAEAQAGHDAFDGLPIPAAKYTNAFPNGAFTGTILSDFYLGIRGNSTLAWGAGSSAPATAAVAAKTGTISAEFVANDFNAGSTVAYQVFYNGVAQGFGTFRWSGANENFIGVDARDAVSVSLDNFKIESVAGLTPQTLRLQINTSSGAASIVGGGSNNTLDFYEINSVAGGLLSGGFNGIRGDGGLPAGNGSGNGWELGGVNSPTSLTEAYLNDESTIAANAGALPLGVIWNTGANKRDLTFTYYNSSGTPQLGFVEYVASSTSADFDGDSDVDGADLLIWQRNLGTGSTHAQGDANGDSLVNASDLAIWRSTFGQPVATTTVTSVPEPASVALAGVLIVSLFLVSVRRQNCDAPRLGSLRLLRPVRANSAFADRIL
jgi:hypothetical protein